MNHVNIGEFVLRNVPSLQEFKKEISNGSDLGALTLLRNAMQLLQRWALCLRTGVVGCREPSLVFKSPDLQFVKSVV